MQHHSAHEREGRMDEDPDDAANDGAVQADELQVAAHRSFKFVGHLFFVPGANGRDDEFAAVGPCGKERSQHLLAEEGIDIHARCLVFG